MDNPEKLATYGTEDFQRNWQHMALKTSRETGNIWHSILPEKLATYGTQDFQRNWQHTALKM
jgi:hypothetical protein